MRLSKTCVSDDNSPLLVTDREIRRMQEYLMTSEDELFLQFFCVQVAYGGREIG